MELRDAVDEGKYVTGRRMAEEILKELPDDPEARLWLAMCLADGEGDLPQAAYYFEWVREWYDANYTQEDDSPWRLHAAALRGLEKVYGAMDRRQDQLDTLAAYNSLYQPKLNSDRVWPLMKLGRMDEARQVAKSALEDERAWVVSYASNGLCAVEGEAGNRQAYYDACVQSFEFSKSQGYDLSVAGGNAALSALSVGEYAAAENFLREGLSGSGEAITNPYQGLADLALISAKGAEAIVDIQKMRERDLLLPPSMRNQSRAEQDIVAAVVLWVAGATDAGLRVVNRAISFPDRMGYSSSAKDQYLGVTRMLRRVLHDSHEERSLEIAASNGFFSWAFEWVVQCLPSPQRIMDTIEVRNIFTSEERFKGVYRPYLFEGLPMIAPWWIGSTVDVLGTGVASESLDYAEGADFEPEWRPFFQAVRAEIEFRDGNWDVASRVAAEAMDGLPSAEQLYRARLGAIKAHSDWKRGEVAEARKSYQKVLEIDPGTFRRLGLSVPVVAEGSGDVSSPAVRRLLLGPRLHRSREGLRLLVTDTGGGAQACFLGASGTQILCASGQFGEEEELGEVVDALHRGLFRMPMGLDNISMNSLDGSPVSSNRAAAQAVDQLLEGLNDAE